MKRDEPPGDPEDPDREICICFHVSRRKIENFIRIRRPGRPGQLSECFGAGTGCGWCRPWLERLWRASQTGENVSADLPSWQNYLEQRKAWRQDRDLE